MSIWPLMHLSVELDNLQIPTLASDAEPDPTIIKFLEPGI